MELESKRPVYLNTAGCGLISQASLQAANNIYNAFTYNSSGRSEDWRDNEAPAYRDNIARFMGIPQSQLGCVPNFSYAMNALVQSLHGDEQVLLYKYDYPSVTAPFVHNHFPIHWLDTRDGFSIDLNEIESKLVKEKISILAISHVQWQTGFKVDLASLSRICQKQGTILILDATQSLGANHVPIVDLGIDVVISSNYKWMNSGFGNGLLYLSESFLKRYPPVIIGAGGADYPDAARSYEPGGLNIYGFALLDQAIREKQAIGLPEIVNQNMRLTQTLLNGLANLKDQIALLGEYTTEDRAPIVVLKERTNKNGVLGDYLAQKGIVVTQRGGTLRISFHFYNRPEEVEFLLDALKEWVL
ncbi:MAG TPA: aminotransferase class V-fold PLP-dependent enzyme [Arachidicoccus sp.]|nr:aminotransferase class V-fold PLP-dependent enzyme [Arachidicoccus sp.]